MLVTTSRKPSQNTRTIARLLARLLGSIYFSRGKASFDVLVSEAEKSGFKRVLVIGEDHGNVGSLSFWQDGWLEPEVNVKSVFLGTKNRVARVSKVDSQDEFGVKLKQLFALDEMEEGTTRMVLNRESVIFFEEGRKVLEFKLR